jgi:hypothetical protein
MRDLEVPKISNSLKGVFGIYKKKKSQGKLLLCLDMLGRLTLGRSLLERLYSMLRHHSTQKQKSYQFGSNCAISTTHTCDILPM